MQRSQVTHTDLSSPFATNVTDASGASAVPQAMQHFPAVDRRFMPARIRTFPVVLWTMVLGGLLVGAYFAFQRPPSYQCDVAETARMCRLQHLYLAQAAEIALGACVGFALGLAVTGVLRHLAAAAPSRSVARAAQETVIPPAPVPAPGSYRPTRPATPAPAAAVRTDFRTGGLAARPAPASSRPRPVARPPVANAIAPLPARGPLPAALEAAIASPPPPRFPVAANVGTGSAQRPR